jgi:hypothetical protein
MPPNGAKLFAPDWNVVAPGYFATLRIPLVAGRDFGSGDRADTPLVAIVGKGTARRLWPGQNAVGKYATQKPYNPKAPPSQTRTLQVVGVVGDPTYGTLLDSTSGLYVYVPMQQQYRKSTLIVTRTTDGRSVGDEIRTVVTLMNPNLPVLGIQKAEDYTALGLVPQRVGVSVSGSLGLVGILLAAIGIYGVTAYAVTRRTREIGIRMALGARRADVIRMILREGMSLTVIGSAIGLILSVAASRLLSGYLLGLSSVDPITFTGAAILFADVGLLACYIPARRATQIHPTEALRAE